MDTNALTRKLEALVPGSVLEARPFGRSGKASIWVDSKSILKAAQALKEEPALAYDWLENLSAMEIDKSLVLTYFLRSSGHEGSLIVRCSLVPESPDAAVDAVSVMPVWPMAAAFECEISELFGIRFKGGPEPRGILPEDWAGYPLRKAYVFPTEFLNIPHMRPVGHTAPDEFGVMR